MHPLIAGNWKMHGTTPQLAEIAGIAAAVHAAPPPADVLICPPSTLITRAAQAAAGRIAIGGQNCAAEMCGAFMGDLSAEMLKDAGAAWVIVGHSERRQHHGETDARVAAKLFYILTSARPLAIDLVSIRTLETRNPQNHDTQYSHT